MTSNRASSTRSDKHELVRAELRRRGGGRVCHRGTYNTSTMNFDSDKVPEKKTQGITPFARKSNLLASTLSGPTASPTWSWATSYAGSGGGGGGGEATDRSRRHRLTVAARAIVAGVRATTFPSYHLGRHLGRLAGCEPPPAEVALLK